MPQPVVRVVTRLVFVSDCLLPRNYNRSLPFFVFNHHQFFTFNLQNAYFQKNSYTKTLTRDDNNNEIKCRSINPHFEAINEVIMDLNNGFSALKSFDVTCKLYCSFFIWLKCCFLLVYSNVIRTKMVQSNATKHNLSSVLIILLLLLLLLLLCVVWILVFRWNNSACRRINGFNAIHCYRKKVNLLKIKIKLNQIFHYTRCITLKSVTSWRAHLLVIVPGKHCSYRRNVAAVTRRWQHRCPIWPGRDLDLRPLAQETNALPLDQLAGHIERVQPKIYLKFRVKSFYDAIRTKTQRIAEIFGTQHLFNFSLWLKLYVCMMYKNLKLL